MTKKSDKPKESEAAYFHAMEFSTYAASIVFAALDQAELDNMHVVPKCWQEQSRCEGQHALAMGWIIYFNEESFDPADVAKLKVFADGVSKATLKMLAP